MSANAKVVKPVTGNSNLVRPRFSPGLLLRDDDLKQGVDYTRDLSRLLFRSLIGCGVVCGLKVTTEFKCDKLVVTVAEGVALDCHGDPIHVPQPQPIPIDPSCGEPIPAEMWVVIRRIEKCCAPRSAACSCDDEETSAVCTREREGYEIRILPQPPECACRCIEAPVPVPAPAPAPPPGPVGVVVLASSGKPTKTKQPPAKVDPTLAATTGTTGGAEPDECWCVDPRLPCYEDHYQGLCGCECGDCDCEWVVLARLIDASTNDKRMWNAVHKVRRFVRPVLMRDPVAWAEAHPPKS
jgi:hypothetical protein